MPPECDSPYDVKCMPRQLEFATRKRKASFLAGRLCAAKAIQSYNPCLSTAVGMDRGGAPIWPDGVVGSITHTDRYVSAAVGSKNQWLGIGIDSEEIIDLDNVKPLKMLVMLAEESSLFSESSLSEPELTSLIFSAKESFFKCFHPLGQQRLDFRSVRIVDIQERSLTFRIHLNHFVGPGFPAGFELMGKYEIGDGVVHTGIELPSNDQFRP